MDDKKEQDLRDVMHAETGRGKRPIDIGEQRRRAELKREFQFLLENGTKEDFAKAIRALGLRDGSPAFEQALAIWNELRGLR